MIKAVKKENNKVALLLSQEEQSITKSAGCLDQEIKLLKMLQLSVKLAQLDFTWKKFHKSNRLFSIKKLYSSQIEFI